MIFDKPRHKVNMKLPLDYPRINQFAEWFTAEGEGKYKVVEVNGGSSVGNGGQEKTLSGKALQDGIAVMLKPGEEQRWRINVIK